MKTPTKAKTVESPKDDLNASERAQFDLDIDRILAYGPSKRTEPQEIEIKLPKKKIQELLDRTKKSREAVKKKKARSAPK
jgi:hypothetical protein